MQQKKKRQKKTRDKTIFAVLIGAVLFLLNPVCGETGLVALGKYE